MSTTRLRNGRATEWEIHQMDPDGTIDVYECVSSQREARRKFREYYGRGTLGPDTFVIVKVTYELIPTRTPKRTK